MKRNKNRGYQKLRVWNDAVDYYKDTCKVFRQFPYALNRVANQAIASSDSVHRNIAEGYCRRSIKEYLNFLNIALASLGESVSGLYAYYRAEQITEEQFKLLNDSAYKIENGLLKLVESLEYKRESGEWIDNLMTKESNAVYASN
ncbi:four helix bundle protein [Thermodesulfobacteriota bacterium]